MTASSRVLSRVALLALPVALLVAGANASPLGHRCRSQAMIGQAEPTDSNPPPSTLFDVDPVAVLPRLAAERSAELAIVVSQVRPGARPTLSVAPLAVAPKTSPPVA